MKTITSILLYMLYAAALLYAGLPEASSRFDPLSDRFASLSLRCGTPMEKMSFIPAVISGAMFFHAFCSSGIGRPWFAFASLFPLSLACGLLEAEPEDIAASRGIDPIMVHSFLILVAVLATILSMLEIHAAAVQPLLAGFLRHRFAGPWAMGLIRSADRFLAEHERSPYSTRAIASMMNRDAAHASDKLVTRWLEELSYGRFDPSGETRRRWSQPAPSSYREAIAYEEEHAWPDSRMPVSEADKQALAILGLWDLLIGLGVPVFHDDARGSLRKASELAEAGLEIGADSMVEAVLAGVPVEDVVGSARMSLCSAYR